MRGIKAGYINFNFENYEDKNNFYVIYPERFLSLLTGEPYKVEKVYPENYKPKDDDLVVELWSMDEGKTGHFAITRKGFNSLQTSLNVEKGKIHSYRVFKRG